MKRRSVSISFVLVYFGIFIVSTVLLPSCSNDDNNPTASESSIPELTAPIISTITSSAAICVARIASTGGEAVTARGVCWSTSQTPTVSDNSTNDGNGPGTFTSKISGLIPETDYYVRAYATNSVGTGYGSAVSLTTFETGKGTVTDIDGNLYRIVRIGNQWWMAENLKVIRYRNGKAIPNVTDRTAWLNITTGARCNYNNDPSYVTTYGRLYNWYAVDDSRNIAPAGWHVPTDEEWQVLEVYLGMNQSEVNLQSWRGTDEGGKMKEVGTTHWKSPNTGATNETGFSALAYGGRSSWIFDTNLYLYLGEKASFWSSSENWNATTEAWYRDLGYSNSDVFRSSISKRNGFNIRCVMD